MAGLKCNHCGCSIRYHGELDGTELVMFTAEKWREITTSVYDPKNEVIHTEYVIPSPYLYQADTIYDDFKGQYCKIWKCPNCGTLHIFNTKNSLEVVSVYTECNTVTNIYGGEEYVIFDDITWDKITELSIPNKDIPALFKPSFLAAITKTYMVIYVDDIADAKLYIDEKLKK